MTIRRLRKTSLFQTRRLTESAHQERKQLRRAILEALEPRQMMAVGPQLIGIQPNNSELLDSGDTLLQAPKELRFRFDDAQVIDRATLNGIRLTRAGGDESFGLATAQSDFGSSGRANILLTSLDPARALTINVSNAVLAAGAAPAISINGNSISITLNSNPNSPTTANQLVTAINGASALTNVLSAKVNGGLGTTAVGGNPTAYSPLLLNKVNDLVVNPGAVVVERTPDDNEVVMRFAESLPDDQYRIEIFGFDDSSLGVVGLRNVGQNGTQGQLFRPTDSRTRKDTIDFRIDLGPQVLSVVPQPVYRINGQLQQQRDTIVVYFDNDKLLVENDANGNPTARSVENPEFYRLIFTADTVRNTDDVVFLPTGVTYNAATNTATLRFASDLNDLVSSSLGPATFRLRIGTRESLPLAPTRQEAAATSISDLNTSGAARFRFTARQVGEAGSGVQVEFTNTGNAGPSITAAGRKVSVNIGGSNVTAQQLLDALRLSTAANTLVSTDLMPGSDPSVIVGNRSLSYSPLTLYGMGSSFDTAMALGAIGSSAQSQTNMVLSSSIDPEQFILDLPGASDDAAHRRLAQNTIDGFEDHINTRFSADATDGISTIYYNFRSTFAFNNLNTALINAITEDQKQRAREVLSLWARYLGIQFVETASQGMTIAAGPTQSIRGIANTVYRNEGLFGVRIDPTFDNSLVVLSATNLWSTEYAGDYSRTIAAAVGMALGLSYAGDLPETTLMRLDPTFLAGSGPMIQNDVQLNASDEIYEPIFPGNQDILHGQFLYRPDSSDIDLYRFEVELGDSGKVGLFTAETYAQRLSNSSELNTNLSLYKQQQATARTNFGSSSLLSVKFEAVRSGAQGNQLQIFFTQSDRGVGALPLILTFPNAISIDLNTTAGSESTVQQVIDAIRNSPAASSLVRVSVEQGSTSTRIGSNVLTQNPVVLSGGKIELISQNDDYFSKDSLMKMSLGTGVYFLGVTASGNDDFNAAIAKTGFGGKTQGKYELRVNFRSDVGANDTIQDGAGGGFSAANVALDGDADGQPGGTYDFWFQTRALDRVISFNAGANPALDGRTLTITGGRGTVQVFEFDNDGSIAPGRVAIPFNNSDNANTLAQVLSGVINSRTQLGVTTTFSGTTIRFTGERTIAIDSALTLIDVSGRTIFVDKAAGPNADGSLRNPFNNISGAGVPNAFASTFPGDIVRIVGNGGVDGNLATVSDNFAYEIGIGLLPGSVLSDGATMNVPVGVTTMIDAGAVFKLLSARIGVGSSNLGIDRSDGAIQVLGAPVLVNESRNAINASSGTPANGRVYFTSWLDQTIGLDTYTPTTSPAAGNWGGISIRRDIDLSSGRRDLENEGIFLQHVAFADVRYGGGTVIVESVPQTVSPIELIGTRATVTDNLVTRSASAAVSASPNSFEETNFNEPRYQISGSFTSDYDRVGPFIRRNTLLNNSINGLFLRVDTSMNVAGRFDDIDIVHVLTDNLVIGGSTGGSLLDSSAPPVALVSTGPTVGGLLQPGIYNYKVTFIDRNGYESVPSDATVSLALSPGQTAITVTSLPGASGDYVERKLYRSQATGSGPYDFVANLDRASSTFLDRGQTGGGTLQRDRADVSAVTLTPTPGGTLTVGSTYVYRVVMVDAGGREGLASNPTAAITLAANGAVFLSNLPKTLPEYVSRRVYRSSNGGLSPFQLIAELTDDNVTSLTDTGANLGSLLSAESLGVKRPRPSGSLVIDPGIVIKSEASRIELTFGANLIAEGADGNPIVFTSRLDDLFGAGGTFDTNNNGSASSASPRDWGGIYASPTSRLSIDHAHIAYAGGITRLDSTFRAFNPIEIHQADARITNTLFENNGDGFGGQGPGTRFGRLSNEPSTIFVRGSQPILIGNEFRGNKGSAITIDLNSMTDDIVSDSGRQTGPVDNDTSFIINRGPLVRQNRFQNNGLNGLKIRAGDILTTASVWDDTDIVHVVYNEIFVGNVQHEGGLRLQSAPSESLVVKFDGYGSNYNRNLGAGLTANGQLTSATDRVGGTLQLLGQPGFPVILTSLRDDTVGAGLRPDGKPQTDTNNDGIDSIPQSADWRGILLDQYSNDRNVGEVLETEDFAAAAPGPNGIVSSAQVLGILAANSDSGDEVRRLGFVVDGVLSQNEDIDVYSFTGVAGSEVWLDIDYTEKNLDLVLEILNANGELLARSDNSTSEASDPTLLFVSNLVARSAVNPLATRTNSTRLTSSNIVKEDGTTNPLDPGMRIRLPGALGVSSTYFVRVRSASTNSNAAGAGLTSGTYQLQVRLREAQEWAGSSVNYADIRYAMNGVRMRGLPGESPLIGESAEDENVRNGEFYSNNGVAVGTGITSVTTSNFGLGRVRNQIGNRPQYVGNVLETARGAISVAGNLSSNRDVDFYAFEVTQKDIVGFSGGYASVVFDMDYADGLNRPDTSINIFQEEFSARFGKQYRLVYSSDASNVSDDQGRPLSIADVADLSRGSTGTKDAYIGPIALAPGQYIVGVSSVGYQPRAKVLNPANFKPINSIRRIVDEGFIQGVTTAIAPVVTGFLPTIRTIGASGVMSSLKTFDLGAYSAADLPTMYIDYTMNAGASFEIFVRESNGTEYAVASSAGQGLMQLSAGSNSVRIPLSSLNVRPVGGGLITRSFAGQDGLSIIFRSDQATTRIDDIVIGFAERGESVGSGDEQILLANGNIFLRAGTAIPPFVQGQPGSWVTTRQFSLSSYDRFLDRPQVAFDYEVFNGQLDVFLMDDAIPGFQLRLATTVNQNVPVGVVLLTTGSPQSAVLDISQFADTFGIAARTQLRVEFRARDDDPSRTQISNVRIELADGSRVASGEPNSTYTTVPVSSTAVTTGSYQLEIRLGDNFFQSQSFGTPTLTKTFDTNDRLAEQITLVAPAGSTLTDGDKFTLSDGGRTLTFEFTTDSNVGLSNVPVRFTASDANFVVARAIRDAINSAGVQSQFSGNIRAATSSGIESGTTGRDPKINLHGSAYFNHVVSANPAGKVGVIFHQGVSDRNSRREQSEIIIQNSFIRESRDYGIWSEAPPRLKDPRDVVSEFLEPFVAISIQDRPNLVGTQAVRNLLQPNNTPQGGMVPGIVVQNNVLEEGGLGGIKVEGETPIWMLTPGLIPHNPTGPDPRTWPADWNPWTNSTNPVSHFGFYIDDQDTLVMDTDRTRLRLEFDDLAGGATGNPVAGSGQVEGNGYSLDSSVAYYRDTGGATYQRLTGGNPAFQPFATNALETVNAFRDSILGSILVSNGTTQTVKAYVAESLLGPDPVAPLIPTVFTGYPDYYNRPALYLEGVANLQWQDGPNGNSNPFDMRQLDLGEAPQPQARIVNNTIVGRDGRATFNGESALSESNDTLGTATQTWQGTAHNPLFYSDVGVIGDGTVTSPSSSSTSSGSNGAGGSFSSDRFLVQFENGVSEQRKTEILANNGLHVITRYNFVNSILVGVNAEAPAILLNRIAEIQALPEVKVAEPDYQGEFYRTPNDPQYPQQWHYDNVGQTGGSVDADIDLPEAWDLTVGSSQTVIAVVDSGVDYNHPDLRSNMWVNPREIAGNGLDDDGNGYVDDIYGIDPGSGDSDPMDSVGHGTHVAGTTAAVGNNGIGVSGVSWASKIMAIKIGVDGGPPNLGAAISALQYIHTMKQRGVNIVVSNHSYGVGFSQIMQDAIQQTIDVGIPFVAASGNSGLNTDTFPAYPASYTLSGIISVAATDDRDALTGFSNFGLTSVDIAAPGNQVLSTTQGGGYGLNSGTSMASPHVAGAIALLASYVPNASVSLIKNSLLLGADTLPQLDGKTVSGGRLNVAKSLAVLRSLSQSVAASASDVDIYQFKLGTGERAIIDVDSNGSGLDSVLQIFDAKGVPQTFVDSFGVSKTISDNDAAQGEVLTLDPYADFTALTPGVYYAAVSSVGNTSFDPLSSANRRVGTTSGAYRITVSARHLQDFVITAEDASAYRDGDTFTIHGVPNLDGTSSTGRTFEFTFGAFSTVAPGNIPIHLEQNWRFPDVAQAIRRAINEGLNNGPAITNEQRLPNGEFGVASPLPPVHAVAIGGLNSIIDAPFRGLDGDKDFLLNMLGQVGPDGTRGVKPLDITQLIRGPYDQVNQGLELFPRRNDGVFVATTTGLGGIGTFTNYTSLGNLGIGHDRQSTNPISYTSLADGTTEKFVLIKNAAWIDGNRAVIVDPDVTDGNNLDQLLPETGVLATRGASPTILNNVFFNLQTPIVNQESRYNLNTGIAEPYGSNNPNLVTKPGDVVVAGSIYQYFEPSVASNRFATGIETGPTNVPNTSQDQNVSVANGVRLFVNAQGSQYFPAPGSPLIDSSVNSLAERSSLAAVKSAMGLPAIGIVAPDYDLVGQLRADDPAVSPPGGIGQNVFKDRGAFDRADFIGPTASLLVPIDNDAFGNDLDQAVSVVRLSNGVYSEFRIQLKDGNEPTNPLRGIGINDDSVTNSVIEDLRASGASVVLTENGRVLTEGIDYRFSYNATRDEIILTPLAGVWKNDRVYDITVNNKNRFVISAPSGDQVSDADTFTITDKNGGIVHFEFESGFRMQLPQTLSIQVPLAGAGAGGVSDGDRFKINDGTRTSIFELDNNNTIVNGNVAIRFKSTDSQQDIANAITAAIATSGLNVTPRSLPDGVVNIGASSGVKVTIISPSLSQPKSTLGLYVPTFGSVKDGDSFNLSDGLTSVTFEFDSNASTAFGNVRIDTTSASNVQDLARLIINAIDSTNLQLAPTLIGTDTVYLGLTAAGSVTLINSQLEVVGVSRSIADGQSFTISFGNITRTFEYDSNNSVASGNIRIEMLPTDTQDALGDRTTAAIANAGLSLSPTHVGGGNISIGGTDQHSISVVNAPSILLFGKPNVSPKTTTEITGSLVLQVPVRGGIDLSDGSTFTITNNGRTVVFEFDDPSIPGPITPGNVIIQYNLIESGNEIADRMATVISQAGLNITARSIGGARVDLGILKDSQVNLRNSKLTTLRGNVTDGEYFSISFGGTTKVFEFVDVSRRPNATAGRIPILFNNNVNTQADVIGFMKAAIESAGLGLTTIILSSTQLRMDDTPLYSYDFSTAPSLTLTGVPGGAVGIPFIQDASFDSRQVAESIIRAINAAGNSELVAKLRGNNTLFVENAVSISQDISNFFLRAVEDLAGNDLKPNRINNETQFTILMPGIGLDYGDAPDPVTTTPGRYPTRQVQDGARHVASAGPLRLGTNVSADLDGQPTPNADGDSGDDGVTFQFQGIAGPVFNKNVDTTITVTVAAPGIVNGWIDFNSDGDWEDPGENILNEVEFDKSNLTRQFQVRIPATTPAPTTAVNSFARFRVSTAGNLLPTGLALDGEVEDYAVRLVPGLPPSGVVDTYTLNEDQVGGYVTTDPLGQSTPGFIIDDGVLANDISPDGRPLSARLVSPPQNAVANSFVFRADGTFEYHPKPDFYGTDTFVYVNYVTVDANQGHILESLVPTTVSIVVRPVNDPPLASNFSLTSEEDTPLVLTPQQVIARSGATPGPTNELNQTLRLSLPNGVSAQGGTVNIVNGNLVYLPQTDFSGIDTFTFRLTDDGETGALSDPQSVTRTVTVTILDRNDPPITTSKSFTMVEDGVESRSVAFVIAGDTAGPTPEITGPNAQTISFVGVEPTSEFGGTVTFANGQVTYRPAADFTGTDRFYYSVVDNGTSQGVSDPRTSRGTVTVNVTPVNDPPRVGTPFGVVNMVEDEAERALLLRTYFLDPDVAAGNDSLTYRILSNSNPTLVEPTFGANDMFVRPKADQNGTAVIVVEARDQAGLTATNTLTLVVAPVNDAPRVVAPLPNLSVAEDAAIANTTLSPTHFFDPDVALNGDTLTFSVVNSNPDLVAASIVNGQLRLVLTNNASGVATITVRGVDSTGNAVESSFNLSVAPVNDAPTVIADSFYVTPQGVVLTTTDARGTATTTLLDNGVLANDSDVEGNTFTAELVTQPTRGSVVMNPNGTFTYTPSASALQGQQDTFTYRARDSQGAVSGATSVTITITAPPPPKHQNPVQRYDVDADGFVSPIDVLFIINYLNTRGSSIPVANLDYEPPPYRDVNGDNFLSPLDVLAVINFINDRRNGGAGEGEGEGPTTGVATPMVWTSDVSRASLNVSSSMVKIESLSSVEARAADTISVGSFASNVDVLLGSFTDNSDEIADNLARSKKDVFQGKTEESKLESLDSAFAELFG